jgi:hypothetical protein
VHSPTTSTKDIRTALVDDKDEIRPQYQESTVDSAAIFTSSLVRDLGPQYGVGSTIDALDNIEIENVGGMNELATPWYSDQILPFDITLAGANEYGAMAAAKLFGIEILNEGTGHSIDDAVTEMQATFVRHIISPQTRGNPRSPCFGTFDIRYRRCLLFAPKPLSHLAFPRWAWWPEGSPIWSQARVTCLSFETAPPGPFWGRN